MFSFVVLLLSLLSISIPPLVSQNAVTSTSQVGVQTSNPLRFTYKKDLFLFGNLGTNFNAENSVDICQRVYAFLGFFASLLDMPSVPREQLNDAMTRKLLSMSKEFKELFEGKIDHSFMLTFLSTMNSLGYNEIFKADISQYFMSVKNSLAQIATTSTCQCTDGTCIFSNPIQNAPVTYTDLYIYQTLRLSGKGPSYWDAEKINGCRQDPKCLVDVVKKSKSLPPTANSPGGNFHTTSHEGESSMVIKVFQPVTPSTFIMVIFYFAFSFFF
ncbi:hypothetical protein HMI54_010118 [Coelomomyces lativittatus]|nr:hypothetical protein HMI56_005033 [Coelomomyces lativittatus]KAJ1500488.1 hypothetical protein HMI55_003869 [Coelomomyces lativittatus]KAJ1501271.1 hypothetical protein HMI54_010118 [Coelomomyces lativittatus]